MSSLNSLGLPVDIGFSTFLWHLFNEGKYTDIYFELYYKGSKASVAAHKLVLACRSSYFADEFYLEEKKINNKIMLTDINIEAFKAMLSYMYDVVPCMETPTMICEIYKVAEEFQVITLMDLCNTKLNNTKVVLSNVFDMLETSEYLQNKDAKDRSLKFLHEHTKEVISYYESEISPSIISTLLSLERMTLHSVLDLFKCIFGWAEKSASVNTSDTRQKAKKTREALEEFLPDLPFIALSYKQFAELYKSNKDVFNEDEVISIFMNLAVPGSRSLPDWYNTKSTIDIKSSE